MTPLNDVLAPITAIGFDTAPFIYFMERHPRYVNIVRDLFERVDHGSITGYTSAVTLTEVLTVPKRQGNRDMANAYIALLTNSRHFMLLAIDAAIAEHAAELRGRYGLRTPDALQIAAALQTGCQGFVTNDKALKHVTELSILVLDELLSP
jgi:predicted nucleic acid-binding protein